LREEEAAMFNDTDSAPQPFYEVTLSESDVQQVTQNGNKLWVTWVNKKSENPPSPPPGETKRQRISSSASRNTGDIFLIGPQFNNCTMSPSEMADTFLRTLPNYGFRITNNNANGPNSIAGDNASMINADILKGLRTKDEIKEYLIQAGVPEAVLGQILNDVRTLGLFREETQAVQAKLDQILARLEAREIGQPERSEDKEEQLGMQ